MSDSRDDPGATAVELLREFGLTEYRARAFVALTRIGEGTAREVSDVAEIPQARVYDCMEALQERSLVDVQRTKPRRFRAIGVESALATLERRYEDRLDSLGSNLSRLDSPEAERDAPGVWTVEGTDGVAERISSLVAGADSEVLLAVADPSLVTDDLRTSLEAAGNRGVDVVVGSPVRGIRNELADATPESEVVETWTWWNDLPVDDGEVSAVSFADDDATLAAVVEAVPGGDATHRAVWASDADSALVTVLRPVLRDAIHGGPPGD